MWLLRQEGHGGALQLQKCTVRNLLQILRESGTEATANERGMEMSRLTELPPHWARLAAAPPTLKQPTMKGGDPSCAPKTSNTWTSKSKPQKPPTKLAGKCGESPQESPNESASNAAPSQFHPARAAARMNKTEAEFALMLEARKRSGEITDYRYEGMRLKWGEDPRTGEAMNYLADFVVIGKLSSHITLIEVKGAHIWDRDKVRFKGCRAAWPCFAFELHQKIKGEWKRIS